MKRIITVGLLTLLTIITIQCRKNDSTSTGNNGTGTGAINKSPIKATLQGNITDENGQPSSGVLITVGDKTATTDNNGYFRITAAGLDKQTSFVSAQKTGYFNAYRSFCATSGTNQIAIQLTKKALSGIVSASTGGTITLSNGAKVALPANGVVNATNNAAYSGTINVYAAYIDPSDNSIAKTIPGSFTANDKNNNRVTLASYGMLAVELQSADGQKLQIATGNTATLTTPIPASLQAKAPATISMWYLNEQTGLWQEEGTATKSGSNYVGTVKHFSFWNCDYSFPMVQLSATIKTSDGLPLTYSYIELRNIDTTTLFYYGAGGYTDSLGVVSGNVPINANLVISVLDECYNVIYSKNIGVISSNTDVGIITVPKTTVGIATITGKLTTCNNTPVANGYAVVSYRYYTKYAPCDNNGNFSTNFTQCSSDNSSCQILGVDVNTGLQGNSTSFPITTSTTNVGNIIACGNHSPYFITLTGKLVDCNNNPVSNGTIDILYNPQIHLNCDPSGNFSTQFRYNPDSSTNCQIIGTNLTAQLQGNPINIDIASILNNGIANVGNIIACGNKVDIPYNITLTGKLVDCNNIPVSNGAVIISNGYNQAAACNSSGIFSTSIIYDPNSSITYQITGIDATAKQQGSLITLPIASLLNGNTANVGNIIACGTTAASNITYSIDGKDSSLLNATSTFGASTYQGNTNIYGFGNYWVSYRGGISFNFTDYLLAAGTFPLSNLYISGYTTIKLIQPFNISITNYPQNIGDNYEGSFSGTFTDSADVSQKIHTITCSFKQPRTN